MKHKIRGLFFALLLMIGLPMNVDAEELKIDQLGSITITLTESENKQPVVGAEFAVYYIATVQQDSSGNLIYEYTEPYADCGVLLDDSNLSEKLEPFVDGTPSLSIITTNHQGNTSIGSLPFGLYYIKQVNRVDGYTSCKPFVIAIPTKQDGMYWYNIDASPKTEIEKLISITIKKQWKADSNAEVPNQVTIQLCKEDVVIETAILNEQNNWEITYSNMPKSDAYSVKEINIPNGFTPIYEQNETTFVVTNVSSLINTGQLVWPIPILAFAGMTFIALGFILIRKSGRNHG